MTSNDQLNQIQVIRPNAETLAQLKTPDFVGISDETTSARAISMNLVIVPPNAVAEPHFHPEHETAIYILKGQVEVLYGQHLEQSQICETGDFVFTPPGVPHQPRNLSATEPVYVLAARNDPSEHEKIVPYDPSQPCVSVLM